MVSFKRGTLQLCIDIKHWVISNKNILGWQKFTYFLWAVYISLKSLKSTRVNRQKSWAEDFWHNFSRKSFWREYIWHNLLPTSCEFEVNWRGLWCILIFCFPFRNTIFLVSDSITQENRNKRLTCLNGLWIWHFCATLYIKNSPNKFATQKTNKTEA